MFLFHLYLLSNGLWRIDNWLITLSLIPLSGPYWSPIMFYSTWWRLRRCNSWWLRCSRFRCRCWRGGPGERPPTEQSSPASRTVLIPSTETNWLLLVLRQIRFYWPTLNKHNRGKNLELQGNFRVKAGKTQTFLCEVSFSKKKLQIQAGG